MSSSYSNRESSSLRYRSGSVERRTTTSSSRDPAPYRTSYGTERGRTRDLPTTTTRMSRATSYDPFASSNRTSSVIRSGGLSNSDYTPRISSYTSRYGSTEQLNSSSSSYRPSSYRSGSITSGSGSSNSTTSSYTPRNMRAGSVTIGAYDPPSNRSTHSDSVSSSTFSRYRPDNSISSYTPSLSRYRSTDLSNTSDYSTSKYRSPDNSYSSSRCSSTVSSGNSNRYSSHKPSSAYSSRTSTSSSYRSDRDYRSMSRTTDNEDEVDEVERTFRKLYRKYVNDSEPDLSKTSDKIEESLAEKVSRRFESKSEAEDDDDSISEEDEDEILSKYQAKGLRRASSASSITPRASVCNSPSKDITPKCSPLPARKELKTMTKSESRSVSPEMKPLSRNFQMEATFGISAPTAINKDSEGVEKKNYKLSNALKSEEVKKSEIIVEKVVESIPDDVPKLVDMSSDEEEFPEETTNIENIQKILEDVKRSEPIKKVVSSIKINGIAVKETELTSEIVENKKEEVSPVRIRIRSDKSPSRTREIPTINDAPKVPENVISSAVNLVLNDKDDPIKTVEKTEESREFSKEKSSESDTTTTSSRASTLRKRRDPNRTLENLQSILKAEKMNNGEGSEEQKQEIKEEGKQDNEEQEKKIRRIPIPLVLITAPSNPSTPLATSPVTTAASICLWNNNESKRTSSSTEDDEEYDEDEEEYTSGDWTEGEDDEEYITDEEEDNEFSVSQTFSLKDHINLRELYPLATSSSNTSALVSEFSDGDTFLADTRKEESRGRVDSLFAIPAPTFTCSVTYDGMLPGDEDDEEWSDEVHSCEEGDDEDFRVLPIARPGSSSLGAYMSPGSMTSDDGSDSNYDGRTVGCTLKLVDKAARKDSEESDESEYYDDEEEIGDESEEYEDEEYWDEEIEYEDEEEYEYEDEEVLEEYVDEEEEEEENDITMKSVESSGEEEEEEEESVMEILDSSESHELFVTPPMKLMTESLVEEMIEEACYGEIPEETLFALDETEVEDYTGQKDVHLIPTFVRQTSENIREESASRFASDRKPATDFAKKAVIQPTKLEKVQVGTKIDTKLAPSEEEKKRIKEEEERKKREEEEERKKKEKDIEMKKKKKEEEEKEKKEKDAKAAAVLAAGKEDKSALRKSALNMKDEDAKKKVATDEKVAAQKARRFGTVSAMAGKFDESEEIKDKKEEKVLYKKSTRLESKDAEKPKRVYEVIKPVINDEFDKQMEEIRKQMKSGSNQLQNKMKDLSKGILTATEEAKSREMEEKRRLTTEKATGAFGKAEEEKARWKAGRDAEAAREYAKIEAEKHLKKKRILIDKPTGETVLNQEKEAPKRTVRRWKPPPPDPNAVIPSFSCGPKESAKPKATTEASTGKSSKPSTPTARRKSLASPITVPKDTAAVPSSAVGVQNIPKSEGAAATRIRNQAAAVAAGTTTTSTPTTVPSSVVPTTTVPSVTDSPKSTSRRYNARRKTQEIVNESLVKPKTKRRKRASRKTRFTRADRDADLLLGYEKNSTFEQLEKLFDQSSRNRRPPASKFEKIRRLAPSKIFISELTDIDKIYKSSEIRDIIASVNMVY